MKRKIIILSIALFSIVSSLTLSAFIYADDPFDALLKKLEEFYKNDPHEKVHLHLDKPYYAVGDDIWFKAYVVDSRNSSPSLISSILYIELINNVDSIKAQVKLPLQSGITWGDFKLPDSLSEGNYRIRAYTQWMRNAGPSYFFDKTIKIGNSWSNKVFTKVDNQYSVENNNQRVNSVIQFTDLKGKPYVNADVAYDVQLNNRNITRGREKTNAAGEINVSVLNTQPNIYKSGRIVAKLTMPNGSIVSKTIPIKTTSAVTDVQFFPESGTLVEGLPSKVAIKAVNANGLGEDVTGKVIDDQGAEILSFETTHLGMGSFIINPTAGRTYRAKVQFKNGTETFLPLPRVDKSGYILAVNNTDTAKMAIKVMISPDLINKGDMKLIAQHNGNVYFVTKVPTGKQLVSVVAPKKDFPSGTVQLTLFSTDNQPVAERMAFVKNNADKINITLDPLKQSYEKRGKVDLSFSAKNNGKPLQGSFSVAVTNNIVVAPDPENESNIFTSLLLSSELTGYVEKPNHYFLNDDAKTKSELDLLMLTQGWRKIDWKKIAASQLPVITYQPEKSMKVSGTITKGGKPVPKGKVSLFSNSQGFFMIDTISDANGRFSFDDIAFTDSVKFVVQARTEKNNKNVQIDLDIVPKQVVTVNKNTGDIEVNVNETMKSYLQQSEDYFNEMVKRGLLERTIMLNEVKIVEKKNPAPNSSNLNGAGRADQIITAKELETAFNLSQYLQGRVAGLTIVNGKAVLMRSGGRGAMSIVLDGMNMGEDFMLDDVNVFDIETVEILKSIGNTAIYGSGGSNGVIVITTKRGGTSTGYNRYAPGIVTYNPKGYHKIREFYAPKYDVKPDTKPDLRTTIYWNPHFASDVNGKANFSFFNSDQAGTHRVVIEGIDATGNLARHVFTYTVN